MDFILILVVMRVVLKDAKELFSMLIEMCSTLLRIWTSKVICGLYKFVLILAAAEIAKESFHVTLAKLLISNLSLLP